VTDDFVSRLERFASLGSTQEVVRDWLHDGEAEVCIAVADTQSRGRGRLDRRWQDRPGRALLVSAGFRPTSLPASQGWRLSAIACLAMRAAADELLGPIPARLAVKWPNDLAAIESGSMRKLGGVLAESALDGDRLATAVVGLGVNVDWPAADFPSDLAATMSSLSEVAGGRGIEREPLLAAWLRQLEWRYGALLDGRFDVAEWAEAQATTGAEVELQTSEGRLLGIASGVDETSGALLVRVAGESGSRAVTSAEVLRCRIRPPAERL
jgi:BirA family biotin operon repressor/biotin-[acetyl-CoA-carboxylase] ligase